MAYTTIDKPTDYFSTNLWVADDSSPRSFTGFGHQPDLVWTKHRGSGATFHTLTDSVRGGDKQISTPTDAAESSGAHGKISAFGSDGITVIDGTNSTYPRLTFNELDPFGASVGGNYVGWSWKAGGTASSNTDGSITSTVSANTTAGFSIVSYTGTGSNATVGHGLGVAPSFVIIKDRGNAISWVVSGDNIGWNKNMYLNVTQAVQTANHFQDTAPTSSLMYLATDVAVNGSSRNYIMYCFAEKKGFSKFGSYTGNGSTDGTFVYTGFKPAFVIFKNTETTANWGMIDNKRDDDNVVKARLFPNLPDSESSSFDICDFTAQGFKLRTTDSQFNSANKIIYMAFAENPFVTSTGIPACAR